MILEDILTTIPKLTTREQLLLLEALTRALRTELETPTFPGSAERLLGIIPMASDVTDDELARIHTEAILEKHS